MKGFGYHIGFLSCWLTLAMLPSCTMIDEDLSDCVEPDKEAEINYELRLMTNITTEITTKLSTEADQKLAAALRAHLKGIFTDFAHDVDLSFYDTQGDSVRLHHDQHIMDASQVSYTLTLPMHHYMHLASANLLNEKQVSLVDDGYCHPSKLQQVSRDTVDSHTTGLSTARLPMDVKKDVDQDFYVRLYMANCAAVLVVDPRGIDARGMKVYSTGFATGLNICDSSYVYQAQAPVVNTSLVGEVNDKEEFGFCSVTFPSKDRKKTRSVIETTFDTEDSGETLWEFRVYVTNPTDQNSITQSILNVRQPLQAGQLFILKGWLDEKGGFHTDDKETVAVSVTLDWNKNQEHEVPL